MTTQSEISSAEPSDTAPGRVRFEFADDRWTGPLARVLTAARQQAFVEIDRTDLTVRFGPWVVTTPLTNVAGAEVTGPYRPWKVYGPHLSLADRGLTFGTNTSRGVCIRFNTPVAGGEPTGRLRHPGVTVTVERPHELADLIASRTAPPA